MALAGSLEKVTPEMAVREAQRPRSPLHTLFYRVSDRQAVREYRLTQARHLLRSLVMYYVDRRGKQVETKVFHAVVDEQDQMVYRPSTFVWRNDDASQQVIREAKRELESWIDRYQEYKALSKAVKTARVAVLAIK